MLFKRLTFYVALAGLAGVAWMVAKLRFAPPPPPPPPTHRSRRNLPAARHRHGDQNPAEFTYKIAAGWRGGDEEDYDEYYNCFRSNGSLIYDHGSQKITKEDFDVMQKYLAVFYKPNP